jgi:hypothetical protein
MKKIANKIKMGGWGDLPNYAQNITFTNFYKKLKQNA